MHQGLESFQQAKAELPKPQRRHVPKLLKWARKSTRVRSSFWPAERDRQSPSRQKIPDCSLVYTSLFLQLWSMQGAIFLDNLDYCQSEFLGVLVQACTSKFSSVKKVDPLMKCLIPSKWNVGEASASWCMGGTEQWKSSLTQELLNVFDYGASVSDPFMSVTKYPAWTACREAWFHDFKNEFQGQLESLPWAGGKDVVELAVCGGWGSQEAEKGSETSLNLQDHASRDLLLPTRFCLQNFL